MLDKYSVFCYNVVGEYIMDYIENFEGLRLQLDKADITITLPEYVSMMVFTSIISGFTLFMLSTVITLFIFGIAGLFIGIATGVISGGLTFVGFYTYPSIEISNRSSKMKDMLPFATLYMSSLAGTGTELKDIFDSLSKQEEYGEVAKEAEKITRDIEVFGKDINEALKDAADRTPNEDFEELLWGVNNIITTGGSLRTFLRERSERFMRDYKMRIEEYSEQLALLVEMYITLVIVGSIIFTSMSAIMSSVTGLSGQIIVIIQIVAIFIGLPILSVMFIVLIDGISPGGIR